ncbi:ribonuclease H2 subunit B-like isoform X1 [Sycon ciliatum]|uniref:ribonuclease H2 subunit B-like isoform X1 n=2 Tax=Sycon ciliatum TaxID=27933 RepID=UPI0031F60F36
MPPKSKKEEEPIKQWVAIAPEACRLGVKSTDEESAAFHTLPHPKSGDATLYLFSPDCKTVCELMKFQNEPRSWFIGETVQKDGSLFVMTPIDPLFLMLPFLVTAAEESTRFSLPDQILENSEYPAAGKLLQATSLSQVEMVCDMKGSGEYQGCRLNQSKLELWLKAKVEQLVSQLRLSKVNVTSGAAAATYVRTSTQHPQATQEEYCYYASGLLSSYLSDKHVEILTKLYPVPAAKSEGASQDEDGEDDSLEPAAKRVKRAADDSLTPGKLDDYRDHDAPQPVSAKKSQTAAQKKLSKVDKSGMKSMTSFFGKKPAK